MRLRGTRDRSLQSFRAMEEYLGGRRVRRLPGRATQMVFTPPRQAIGVFYQGTEVVRAWRDGAFELRANGWHTATTKARLNQYSPVRVSQCDGEWTVRLVDGSVVPFVEGMTVWGER